MGLVYLAARAQDEANSGWVGDYAVVQQLWAVWAGVVPR